MDDIETKLNIVAAAESPEDEGRDHKPIKPAVLLHQSHRDPRGDVPMIHYIAKSIVSPPSNEQKVHGCCEEGVGRLSLQYRSYIGQKDSHENIQLLMIKRDVLRFTDENNREYFRITLKIERESKPKKERLRKRKERMVTKVKEKKKKTLKD